MSKDKVPVQNRDAFRAYEDRKRERQAQRDRINTLEEKVAELQRILAEIIGKR
jgi:polyhydroxyalkanoate synthesis regulator phasin